jgi:hypothetical protein
MRQISLRQGESIKLEECALRAVAAGTHAAGGNASREEAMQ